MQIEILPMSSVNVAVFVQNVAASTHKFMETNVMLCFSSMFATTRSLHLVAEPTHCKMILVQFTVIAFHVPPFRGCIFRSISASNLFKFVNSQCLFTLLTGCHGRTGPLGPRGPKRQVRRILRWRNATQSPSCPANGHHQTR